jgi:hypothetical protein
MPELVTCTVCGDEDTLTFSGDIGARMRERRECFRCAFWLTLAELDKAAPENVAIIGGCHYIIAPDRTTGPPSLAGMGGARCVIAFHDGRERVTHNLWHQGTIPDRFRDLFPDNASWGETGRLTTRQRTP